jgi:hypothetical protein
MKRVVDGLDAAHETFSLLPAGGRHFDDVGLGALAQVQHKKVGEGAPHIDPNNDT